MQHDMRLQKEYFNQIKEGKKHIEYRLFDEKRRGIQKGDTICFSCEKEQLFVKVIDLVCASNFVQLKERLIHQNLLKEEFDPSIMRSIYSKEKEDEYGVLAIFIEQ